MMIEIMTDKGIQSVMSSEQNLKDKSKFTRIFSQVLTSA
jgi:hypothetical protein